MTNSSRIMMFEPQFRAGNADLRNSVLRLSQVLLDQEAANGRRRRARKEVDRAKFKTAVEALACNLIAAAATGSDSKLAIPRSHGVMWSPSTSPIYGSHFLSIIGLMSQLGLVEEGERGFRVSANVKMASTIIPTPELNRYLPLRPAAWRSIQQIDDDTLILLKTQKVNGKAESQPFSVNVRTRQLTRQISAINAVLREAKIEIDGLTDHLTLGEDGRIVVPFRRSLRRIFNNANWQHGGRLAGGFWMSMPRNERHRIRINDEESREVDYPQLHPRLAYARSQQPPPEGDIYDIFGDGTCREGWKRLFNAMLFSKGSLKNWPKETLQHFPKGTKLRVACDLLRKKHWPIANLFGKQLGFSLMKIESDLLIRVMTNLAARGCVCLPLHDAVIVGASHVKMAAEVMQEAFETGTGTSLRAIVSVK